MRKKKLILNTICSIMYQIVAIVCGFILPRLILKHYHSEINGLVNSITQFLQIISVLDLGVGSVVQSYLYKPLAEKNNDQISRIFKSAKRFFDNIAKILIIYICLLPILFRYVVSTNFSFIYIAGLIFSISISYLAQYFFGIVNQLLVTADQMGFIQYLVQTMTLIINTFVCSILIKKGCSIHIVKLTTSAIFLIRPIVLTIFVHKHYNIDYNVELLEEPMKQKWNGLAQHLAAVVLDSTDTIVLTLFASLVDVSIYSTYFLVIHGVRQLIQIATNGVQSFLGNIVASDDKNEKTNSSFKYIEWSIHTITTFIFGCTAILIVPFVRIYTKGISDANYENYLFGFLITIAHGMYCYRLPYHILVKAKVHYKETQTNYFISMIINIVISVLLVKLWGLVGVAIGTLVAMGYQTIWLAIYSYKNLLLSSVSAFWKQIVTDFITIFIGIILTINKKMKSTNTISWIILATKVSLIWIVLIMIINIIMYRNNFIVVIDYYKKKRNKNEEKSV